MLFFSNTINLGHLCHIPLLDGGLINLLTTYTFLFILFFFTLFWVSVLVVIYLIRFK